MRRHLTEMAEWVDEHDRQLELAAILFEAALAVVTLAGVLAVLVAGAVIA